MITQKNGNGKEGAFINGRHMWLFVFTVYSLDCMGKGERIVMILYFLLLLRLGVWLADDDTEKTYIERQLL